MFFSSTRIFCLSAARALLLAAALLPALSARSQCAECDDCRPRFALKTNLLHDAALTPDLGVEISIGQWFSASVEGVWASWSKDAAHRYWQVRGGWGELRVWPGEKSRHRALTGHHVGVYGSMHTYDFEFGGKGWQSKRPTYSAGMSYGYSFALNNRLNLDISARLGYLRGDVTVYRPQCGVYTCVSSKHLDYFGPTGLEVTLVWFPGGGNKNNPVNRL